MKILYALIENEFVSFICCKYDVRFVSTFDTLLVGVKGGYGCASVPN